MYALLLCLGISSCINDDKGGEIPVPPKHDLELEFTEVRIELQKTTDSQASQEDESSSEEGHSEVNIATVKIISGEGDFLVFPMHEKVATAHYNHESNSIVIEGQQAGDTRVVVVDGNMQSKFIDVNVFEH